MRGLISIVLGIVFIIGGLSGKMVFIGTQSGTALAVAGGVIILLGIFRLSRGT